MPLPAPAAARWLSATRSHRSGQQGVSQKCPRSCRLWRSGKQWCPRSPSLSKKLAPGAGSSLCPRPCLQHVWKAGAVDMGADAMCGGKRQVCFGQGWVHTTCVGARCSRLSTLTSKPLVVCAQLPFVSAQLPIQSRHYIRAPTHRGRW